MKKAILFLMMAIISLAAMSQTKKETVPPPDVKKEVQQSKESVEQKGPTDTLVIDFAKYRYVMIKGEVNSNGEPKVNDLAAQIPLFVPYKWIIDTYVFLNDAKSGLSVSEVQQNYLPPLLPFWIEYQKQMQQQQQEKVKQKDKDKPKQ